MNSPLAPLVWKEFRERRLPLLLGLAWMLLGTVYAVGYEVSHRFHAPVATFSSTAMLFGIVTAVLIAMRTALGETTDRSRGFSDGLPISVQSRGWVRLAGGWLVLALPMLAAALLMSAVLGAGEIEQAPPRDARAIVTGDEIYVPLPERGVLSALGAVGLVWQVTALALAATSQLYLLAVWIGLRMRSEARAGYVGGALAVVWLLTFSLRAEMRLVDARLVQAVCALLPQARVVNWGYGVETGSYSDLDLGRGLAWSLAINLALQLGLAWLVVRYYGRRSDWRPRSGESATRARTKWLPRLLPLPTRDVSLGWLAIRNSLPMAIPGLVIACALALTQLREHPHDFGGALSQTSWFVAGLWGVVVGAGLFAGEIDPRIGEFWRTRPISPLRLFLVKFVVGLVVMLLVLDGPTIALKWNDPAWGSYNAMNWPHAAIMFPLHATMFAVAVACTCLTRHAALGGLLTFVLFTLHLLLGDAFPMLDPIQAYNTSGFTDQDRIAPDMAGYFAPAYPVVITGMGLTFVIAFTVGWWALKRYRPHHAAQG